MAKIVVVGGGWSGVSAAICARMAGADVTLVEKTDMLLGAGNVGGIFRNNGRFTAAEEMIQLGAGMLFEIMDRCALHSGVSFPGHEHASLYDVGRIEPEVRELVLQMGIHLMMLSHVMDVVADQGLLRAVVLDDGTTISADSFVETTGSSGPTGNCLRYGNGCSMCIQRCPTFGPRISLTAKCGMKDLVGVGKDGTPGVFSGSCEIDKGSLGDSVRRQLDEAGVAILMTPAEDVDFGKLRRKACVQYARDEYCTQVILLDTGSAKLMTSYYPLDKLRKVPGLESARYQDPYSGSKGNSVRFLSVAPCLDTMQSEGVENLFCGGEKGAPLVGHTEAIVTGALAGHNAARLACGKAPVTLPESLAVGAIIAHAHRRFVSEKHHDERFTFSGGSFFDLMRQSGLYTTDTHLIAERVKEQGCEKMFAKAIV